MARGPSLLLSLSCLVLASAVSGQALTSHIVVPQRQVFALDGGHDDLRVRSVEAWVGIVDGVATTSLRVQIANTGSAAREAELLLPVPAGAAVRTFRFDGDVEGASARLLERDEARALYEAIVERARDPALLEFCGRAALRSSVFPVPAGGVQRLHIAYEQVLPRDGARVDYELPRSESSQAAWVPWSVQAWIRSSTPVSAVFSSSHEIAQEQGGGLVNVRLEPEQARTPGDLRLSYLVADDGLSATQLAWPDPDGDGGYLLLMAGLPETPSDAPRRPRELTLVVDRSGSMRGGKLDQARAAALSVLAGLGEHDRFRLLVYGDSVEALSEAALPVDDAGREQARRFLEATSATGSTALHAALRAALAPTVSAGCLAAALVLTDGRPTVGLQDESSIRADLAGLTDGGRRLFVFGVGDDVNAPLLDALAGQHGGASSYVHPGEDVEQAVSQVFDRLTRPVLERPRLEVLHQDGRPAPLALVDLQPSELPDLFVGEPLSVLARYTGDERLRFRLRGTVEGLDTLLEWGFDPSSASQQNDVVPRLWAARRTAELVDRVRMAGAGDGSHSALTTELVDEVVALSLEFGVMSEYTAFLAEQGTDLSHGDELRQRTRLALATRAERVRVGRGAVVQAVNLRRQRLRLARSGLSTFQDSDLREVRVAQVRRVGGDTFFRRESTWIDAAVVRARQAGLELPEREVAFGSEGFVPLARALTIAGRGGVFGLRGRVTLVHEAQIVTLVSG